MIVVIDNYDSFTYNIVQVLQRLASDVRVLRSKECTVEDIEKLFESSTAKNSQSGEKSDKSLTSDATTAAPTPNYLVIGPGPGEPRDAGVSIDAIKHFAHKVPILGVCLGHQAIGEAFGAAIIHAKNTVHGKVEDMTLDGRGLFRTLGKKGTFVRYHSLVIDSATLPKNLEVTARSSDGDIMGVRDKGAGPCIEGIQFHPESIASQGCDKLFKSFLNYRTEPLVVKDVLNKLVDKKDLTARETYAFMMDLTDGIMDERATAAILTAISCKGVSADELFGAAKVLCEKKTPLPISGSDLAEIVGTGGDGKGSFNISSLSALVVASCGQKVAKHGNKAVSSKSGAADFYKALGIKIDTTPERAAAVIKETGFGFLMAPIYHGAMKAAAPVRAALGIKTIMNILGPLSNPACAAYQLLGVYSPTLLKSVGRAAKKLGAKRVMVVSSDDGYDEISPCAATKVFQVSDDGKEYEYTIDPKKLGIEDIDPHDLDGGTAAENAALAMQLLNGAGVKGLLEAVSINAGALLYLSGRSRTIKAGYDMAKTALKNGTTLKKLQEVITATNKE